MIFFLNSTSRIYKDNDLNKLTDLLFSNGIFNTKSTTHDLWRTGGDFLVEANASNMNITAKAGSATIKVTSDGEQQQVVIQENSPLSAVISNNPSLAVRMDSVVLRINQAIITTDSLNEDGDNAVSLTVVAGNSENVLSDAEISLSLGGDPFLRLADIAVPLNATAITQEMITDRRTLSTFTRSAKASYDILRFYARTDPNISELEKGDIWLNEELNILKIFNGEYVTSLQLNAFDWGYYPPNGVDGSTENFEPIVENDGSDGGLGNYNIYYTWNLSGDSFTQMTGQVFRLPAEAMPSPFIRVKMGAPLYPTSIRYSVYTVNGSDQPLALVQTVRDVGYADVPQNDYVDLYLNGSLYTVGVKYMLVVQSIRLGQVNGGAPASSNYIGVVQFSNYDADTYLVGSRQASINGQTTNPLSITWGGTLNTGRHLLMQIASREEMKIGETDAGGNVHKVSQVFTAKSRDLIGLRLIKGTNIGSPTGSLSMHLYQCNEQNEPIGDVLTTATVEAADWIGDTGTEIEFPLNYDQLVVGTKYAFVLDTEFYSNSDNYTVYFGNYSKGKAKRFNTVDGYIVLAGDLFFSTVTSSASKIVVTRPDGKIPANLFEFTLKKTGVFSKNLADADALSNVIPHELGRVPFFVRVKGIYINSIYYGHSDGAFNLADGGSQRCVFIYTTTSTGAIPQSNVLEGAVLRMYGGATANWFQQATITVDDENITFTWAKIGTPSGTVRIIWEAE